MRALSLPSRLSSRSSASRSRFRRRASFVTSAASSSPSALGRPHSAATVRVASVWGAAGTARSRNDRTNAGSSVPSSPLSAATSTPCTWSHARNTLPATPTHNLVKALFWRWRMRSPVTPKRSPIVESFVPAPSSLSLSKRMSRSFGGTLVRPALSSSTPVHPTSSACSRTCSAVIRRSSTLGQSHSTTQSGRDSLPYMWCRR